MKLHRNIDQHVQLCTRYFRLDLFSIFRVIALDLENFCSFQLVASYSKKDLTESLNLMGRLLSIFRFAPGVSLMDLSSIYRVISLDLVKRLTEQWRGGGTRVLWTHF
jgi:hypothetical protein